MTPVLIAFILRILHAVKEDRKLYIQQKKKKVNEMSNFGAFKENDIVFFCIF